MMTKYIAAIVGVLGLLLAIGLSAQSGKSTTDQGSTPNGTPFQYTQGQIAALNAQIAALQAQIAPIANGLQAQIDSLNGQVTSLHAEIVQAESYLQWQVADLKTQVTSLSSQMTNVQGWLNWLQAQLTSDQSRITALQTTTGQLQSRVGFQKVGTPVFQNLSPPGSAHRTAVLACLRRSLRVQSLHDDARWACGNLASARDFQGAAGRRRSAGPACPRRGLQRPVSGRSFATRGLSRGRYDSPSMIRS
jgi:hypothetical protein